MQDSKNKVEAILFTTGKFMSVEEISSLLNLPKEVVASSLRALKEEYDKRDSSLMLYEENGKWKLNIKKEYLYLTQKLLKNSELDKPIQETLAVIAYKQPAIQAEVVKIRGNKAYDHIKFLKEAEFITSEKYGRTRLLRLTQKFYDYFDVVEKELKEKMNEAAKSFYSREQNSGETNEEKL